MRSTFMLLLAAGASAQHCDGENGVVTLMHGATAKEVSEWEDRQISCLRKAHEAKVSTIRTAHDQKIKSMQRQQEKQITGLMQRDNAKEDEVKAQEDAYRRSKVEGGFRSC